MAFERLFRRVGANAFTSQVPSIEACPDNDPDIVTSRRGFLSAGLGLAAATVATGAVMKPAEVLAAVGGPRRLSLRNMNTGEKFSSVYWRDGYYVQDSLQKLNILLRDHRANEVHRIDPQLFDLLTAMGQRMSLGGSEIQIVSAYRAPRTNALRAAESRGVAQNSFHIQGMALDIRLPGRDLKGIYNTAVSMGEGGVGFYRRSGFVHVDTGPVRTWGAKKTRA